MSDDIEVISWALNRQGPPQLQIQWSDGLIQEASLQEYLVGYGSFYHPDGHESPMNPECPQTEWVQTAEGNA